MVLHYFYMVFHRFWSIFPLTNRVFGFLVFWTHSRFPSYPVSRCFRGTPFDVGADPNPSENLEETLRNPTETSGNPTISTGGETYFLKFCDTEAEERAKKCWKDVKEASPLEVNMAMGQNPGKPSVTHRKPFKEVVRDPTEKVP